MGLWIRFRYWIPKVSAIVNGILTAAWGAGFGLLVNAMHETILVPCTKAQWGNDRGILVCTLYKALLAAGGFGV
jgi:hypothetical protein